MKHVVVIGGGTGTFTVLSALKKYPLHLSVIVSMADDGGSTGMLRDQYGVLPPGSVRQSLVALSDSESILRELFSYRFNEGGLHGHNFGNLFLTALEKITGDFTLALREASIILNVNGEVVPVTLDDVRLYAELEDGKMLRGETQIDIPKSANRTPIKKVWLQPEAKMNPSVRRVLHHADLIVIGPGDLYTSVIPNLLVKGVSEAIRASKAKKVYITNTMTKFGETSGFSGKDFVEKTEEYLGKKVLDYVIFNNKKPAASVLKKYKKERAELVSIEGLNLKNKKPKYIFADLLDPGALIRHNQKKLAKVILSLL